MDVGYRNGWKVARETAVGRIPTSRSALSSVRHVETTAVVFRTCPFATDPLRSAWVRTDGDWLCFDLPALLALVYFCGDIAGVYMADDFVKWLDGRGLGKYRELFTDNEIDLGTLPLLTEEDLKELGLPLGARRKLQAAIEQLPQLQSPSTPSSATGRTPSSTSESSLNTDKLTSPAPSASAWGVELASPATLTVSVRSLRRPPAAG